MDALHLPALEVLDTLPCIGERGRSFDVAARHTGPAPTCCGSLKRHGWRTIQLADTPAHGGPVRLHIEVQRWRCDGCSQTHTPAITCRDPDFPVTKRLARLVFDACCDDTFAAVARRTGLSATSVRGIFWRTAKAVDHLFPTTAPNLLGIDEVHLPRQSCAVLTDLENGTVVELLPGYGRSAVADAIRRMHGHEHIRAVAMDFHEPYPAALRDVYGDAHPPIVVDKRHMLEVARRAMDQVRKRSRAHLADGTGREIARLMNAREPALNEGDRARLHTLLESHPRLRDAHATKEAFYRIFDRTERGAAEHAFEEWAASIPEGLSYDFRTVVTTVRRRHNAVFAIFDWPGTTNAVTENINGRIKALHRDVKGYRRTHEDDLGGFHAFRLLVLHRLGERRPEEVACRQAADAIISGQAPWRERSVEEEQQIVEQARAHMAGTRRRA